MVGEIWTISYVNPHAWYNFFAKDLVNGHSIKVCSIDLYHHSCDNCKIPSCNFYSKEAELKIAMFVHKNFKSLYGFGGRCLKIRDVCMDFEAYFKVHSLVSVILGQMTNLNMIFHVVVSDYRLVKI